MSDWKALHVDCPEELGEMLIAELSLLPYETFEEREEGISAFCRIGDWRPEETKEILEKYGLGYKFEDIEEINWNEEWENQFDPIDVDGRCLIRASFHAPSSSFQQELIINPKMSFGTGHHASTYLMVQWQMDHNHSDEHVLDYGTGTGVLAILAEKLGASQILAIDNNEWSVSNSQENVELNECKRIEIREAELTGVEETGFDLILANINKNVLLDTMRGMVDKLRSGGFLVMSGFFTEDLEDLTLAAQQYGLSVVDNHAKDKWARLTCSKA